jgi:hypothetical protein
MKNILAVAALITATLGSAAPAAAASASVGVHNAHRRVTAHITPTDLGWGSGNAPTDLGWGSGSSQMPV